MGFIWCIHTCIAFSSFNASNIFFPKNVSNIPIIIKCSQHFFGFQEQRGAKQCRTARKSSSWWGNTSYAFIRPTLPLTCGSLGPKRGPKVGCDIIVPAGSWTQDLLALIPYWIHAPANSSKSPNWWREVGNIFQHSPSRLGYFSP